MPTELFSYHPLPPAATIVLWTIQANCKILKDKFHMTDYEYSLLCAIEVNKSDIIWNKTDNLTDNTKFNF